MENKNYKKNCRVCGYEYDEPPWGIDDKTPLFEICPCCGNQFGYNDCNIEAIRKYRSEWIINGANWFNSKFQNVGWNLFSQLKQVPPEWI